MIVPILFAALGFVNPDGIVAPENVDVRIASNGVVEVRAPDGGGVPFLEAFARSRYARPPRRLGAHVRGGGLVLRGQALENAPIRVDVPLDLESIL